jgi:hypothetical protein
MLPNYRGFIGLSGLQKNNFWVHFLNSEIAFVQSSTKVVVRAGLPIEPPPFTFQANGP